jgi:hypothetical protein
VLEGKLFARRQKCRTKRRPSSSRSQPRCHLAGAVHPAGGPRARHRSNPVACIVASRKAPCPSHFGASSRCHGLRHAPSTKTLVSAGIFRAPFTRYAGHPPVAFSESFGALQCSGRRSVVPHSACHPSKAPQRTAFDRRSKHRVPQRAVVASSVTFAVTTSMVPAASPPVPASVSRRRGPSLGYFVMHDPRCVGSAAAASQVDACPWRSAFARSGPKTQRDDAREQGCRSPDQPRRLRAGDAEARAPNASFSIARGDGGPAGARPLRRARDRRPAWRSLIAGVVRGAAVVYDFAPRKTMAVVRVVPMHDNHRGALRGYGRNPR